MRDGFIKAIGASFKIQIADCASNAASIKKEIDLADGKQAALLVLPELCVTGSTCEDLFSQRLLRDAAERAVLDIIEYTKGKAVLVICGAPLVCSGLLYNAAAVICDGELLGVVPKSGDENGERRYFAPAPRKTAVISVGGRACPFGTGLLFDCRENPDFQVGVEIGETLFSGISPGGGLAAAGAAVIANLSASGELAGKAERRRNLIRARSGIRKCGYVYIGARGDSTNDAVYSGHGLVAECGDILAENPPFGPGFAESEIDVGRIAAERLPQTAMADNTTDPGMRVPFSIPMRDTVLTRTFDRHPFLPPDNADAAAWCETVLDIQSAGLAKRMTHIGAPKPVIGVSGGLDSALALFVIRRAMQQLNRPAAEIIAVSMPCFGTTERTRANARKISGLVGASFREIDIAGSVSAHLNDIGHSGAQDTVFENAQARERTQVLMDIANMENGFVVGTGDLSELALGWCTYNGDHMSMYAVNCGVPKTLVRYLTAHIALKEGGELRGLLQDILETPVSPELLSPQNGTISQKTESVIGPFDLQDFFLYHFVRRGADPMKIRRMANSAFRGTYTDGEIVQWLRVFISRFFAQQYKRTCVPNGPQICDIGLSPRGSWRMPSDACRDLWLSELR